MRDPAARLEKAVDQLPAIRHADVSAQYIQRNVMMMFSFRPANIKKRIEKPFTKKKKNRYLQNRACLCRRFRLWLRSVLSRSDDDNDVNIIFIYERMESLDEKILVHTGA